MGLKPNQQMNEFQCWLTLLRISNAPTVISNIMVGLTLAISVHSEIWTNRLSPPRLETIKPLLIISIGLVLIYFAGMILNDAIDSTRDKVNRPERPIPSGVIKNRDAWIVGFILLVSGVLISILSTTEAFVSMCILSGCVILYTFTHKWFLPAIIIMAICRGLVYLVAMSAFYAPPPYGLLIPFTIAIATYTALLSFLGRFENVKGQYKKSWIVWLLILPPFIPLVFNKVSLDLAWIFLIGYIFWVCLAWLDFKSVNSRFSAGMHKTLAGFCLLDSVLIGFLGVYHLVLVSGMCFLLTIVLHRRIIGT
jgi:4-hydroxybenzoate polyprenyltransferase